MNSLVQHDLKLLETNDFIIGVDEAGRGTLAGPVTAAALMLNKDFFSTEAGKEISELADDSKKLSKPRREELEFAILEACKADLLVSGVAFSNVGEIAQHNILGATRIAMLRAIEDVLNQSDIVVSDSKPKDIQKTCLLVDGRPLKPFLYKHQALVKGDSKSTAIAMASILAKVGRDRYMKDLALKYPLYGFEKHAGYGTKFHTNAIKAHGPCDEHRALFLRKILQEEVQDSFVF